MENSLIRIEKHALAKMDTATLADTIDRIYDNAQESVRRWEKEARIAKQDMMSAQDDNARIKSRERLKHCIQRMDEASRNIMDYIDEQRALFASRGLNKDMAFTSAIVATGETNANGVEIMRIVQRPNSIAPFYEDESVMADDRRAMDDAELAGDFGDDDGADISEMERMWG